MAEPRGPATTSIELLSAYRAELPEHEIEMLLEAAYAAAHPDRPRPVRAQLHGLIGGIEAGQWLIQAEEWIARRIREKIPVQHLTQEAHFHGRILDVGPEVLLPRPETEALVDIMLAELKGWPSSGPIRGAEIGLGSGAISITLLSELGSSLLMVGSELEAPALRLALRNAERHGVAGRLEGLAVQDARRVLEPLAGRGPFDFLVSNPPYLARDSAEVQDEVSRFEPAAALFAPEGDLLYFYREIARGAVNLLKPGGIVWLEVPHERASLIEELFKAPGSGFGRVSLLKDLAGRDRILRARVLPECFKG
jgi:release factor glutamine methyltransferase